MVFIYIWFKIIIMTKEEKQKLNEKELYKLFDKGDIDAREFDELRKALPSYEQEKLNSMLRRKKKSRDRSSIQKRRTIHI